MKIICIELPERLNQGLMSLKGQITFDLHPDSLFLRHLNRHDRHADRYYVFRGRALSGTGRLAVTASLGFTRALLRDRIEKQGLTEPLTRAALRYSSRLKVPREWTDGDMAVTLKSATLPDVARLHTSKNNHMGLTRKDVILAEVTKILLAP